MKEGWAKALFLSKKIDKKFEEMNNKMNSIIKALTNITLTIKGVGQELAGTTVRISNGEITYEGIFDSNLKLSFQLDSLGSYSVVYQHTPDQTKEEQVVISDYGYFEVTVKYFPGYDLWQYWANLAGINVEPYPSITQLLSDELARLTLMSSVAAVDYMAESTAGIISGAVLNSGDVVKTMIRSSYAVQKIKESSYWRNALLNNSIAAAACYEAKDALKSLSASASVKDVYAGNNNASKNKTTDVDITDSKMLLIAYTYKVSGNSSDNGTTSETHFANMNGKVYVNGAKTIDKNISAWSQGSYASNSTSGLLYNKQDIITALSAYTSASSWGASASGTMLVVFYYL